MARRISDLEALDQIAGLLGLYLTDEPNNPPDSILQSIVAYVQATGRSTDVPEGA